MGEINDVNVPIKYELRHITKEKDYKYGKPTFIYRFTVFVNGKKTNRKGMVYADSIEELRKHIIKNFF